jgi:succinate dehydrogenase / fumarate reductase flavoprotein subunit
MFSYIPEYFKGETADDEKEADAWYADKKNNRRTPDLLPRDEVARAINSEVKAGRGSPHGGVFLDIHTRRSADYIRKRLPSMYHQFKELAGVDITREAMEVGPTCHYIMGGIRVDADTEETCVPGLYAAGEVAGGMHGANRLGGNSLSDLIVFGRRAGLAAAAYVKSLKGQVNAGPDQAEAAAQSLLEPFRRSGNENPYAIHADLHECMQALVGIIRTEGELRKALEEIAVFRQRLGRARVSGGREFNPGWHLALDLHALLSVSEAVTLGAIERKESRGGHTRDDYPFADDRFGKVNVVVRRRNNRLTVAQEPLPEMPDELKQLLQERK